MKILGRVFTARLNGNETIAFVHLVDGSSVRTVQCISVKSEFLDDNWDDLFHNISRGTTLIVSGHIVESPAKGQDFELVIKHCHFIGPNLDSKNYPLASRGFISRNTLRTIPHLRHHRPQYIAIQNIKKTLYKSLA